MQSTCNRWRILYAAMLAAAGVLAPSSRLLAQGTGSIAGKVTDERGTPVAGAQVTIVQLGKGAVTTANGTYLIEAVAAGSHAVRVRIIGYRSQTHTVAVAAGQRVTQDFTLAPDPLNLEAVVVTGTETPRTKLETSNATTVLSAADLVQAAPRSTTEALRYVPGFTRVESSGGEVNENYEMRGILGIEYIMFLEDGMPVFPTMHTFFMNADNLFRIDQNIERMEVVRGAGSALFGSNTPGAIINLINHAGGPEAGGSLMAYGGTGGLARYDFNVNGPIGPDWRFNAGGFYRYNRGARFPGFPGTAGGQFKASITDSGRSAAPAVGPRAQDQGVLAHRRRGLQFREGMERRQQRADHAGPTGMERHPAVRRPGCGHRCEQLPDSVLGQLRVRCAPEERDDSGGPLHVQWVQRN